jgi:hypothetical protein
MPSETLETIAICLQVKDTKKPAERVTFVYAAAKMPVTTLIFEMFLLKALAELQIAIRLFSNQRFCCYSVIKRSLNP